MASFNKVILMGNLTREPEAKYNTCGACICSFGLAMNRSYTTAAGEKKEEVVFVDAEAWGKLGETVKQYLHKGSQALVEGRLRMNEWETPAGKRSKLSVTADNVRFLSSPQWQGQAPQAPVAPPTFEPPRKDAEQTDDIPF